MAAQHQSSIQDVAAMAGVSTATVSRVLNNANLVAPQTAARVHEAIKQLGYRPNRFAQGLMTSKSHVLGIALPDIHGEFYSELLRGADAEARRLGYHLLVSSEARTRAEQEQTGSLAFGLVDGLAVMLAEPNDALWREAKSAGIPLVVIDADLRHKGFDSVVVDNETGTREATTHLLESVPPAKCFFVGGPKENFDTRQRAAVFNETLERAGAKPGPDQIVHGTYSVAWGNEWAQGMAKARRLKGAGVLAGNDEVALGVLHAAQEHGLSSPKDLRIVGFDDTRLASLVRPTLSTVRVPLTEVGSAAIRALVERIEEPDRAPRTVSLATKLIARESSATGKR